MLQLKKISKSYKTESFEQHALQSISLSFRSNEFVAILGPSGSGKTTLLNIIGGLDHYDSGDLIINNKSTKKFKEKDWNAYRNNCIGFIFQSYNLIGHINVLDNVEMSLTLSGVSRKVRKQKALEALKKVGLEQHAHKKPNQLSGGQMQRVAIARALVNDPDVILADEPTGALDSKTSVQIMDLIKDIAKDKLVIMVTHNKELADSYATRIVELKDGKLISDSDPVSKDDSNKEYNIKKTAMSFKTALSLSFNNIRTKKGRTLLTAFASSIGIIGIALILSLSNGFNIEVEKFQRDALSSLPIIISEQTMELDEEAMMQMHNEAAKKAYPSDKKVFINKSNIEKMLHTNNIDKKFVDYVEKINPDYVSGIAYNRATAINALVKTDDKYTVFDSNYFAIIPKSLDNSASVINDNYDLLEGKVAENKNELVLVVDGNNGVSEELLKLLGYDITKESIDFKDIIDKELKVILNNEWYKNMGAYFTLNNDYQKMYDSKNNITLKIVGIIRGKENNKLVAEGSGLAYTDELVNEIVKQNSQSDIVLKQIETDYNVLTGELFTNNEKTDNKELVLSYLGNDSVPVMVSIYPRNFDTKDEIINYLNDYNKNLDDKDKILYTDMADLLSSLSGSIMDAITIVLIAFSSISLIVSSIMIGIITYISVLERTKEIGILRAMGARKKDIARVFNAETIIIGLASGLLGLLIARILIFPANSIIYNLSDLPNVAKMHPLHAIILLLISMILTVIGGYIPAKIASRKDPVEALRTE